MTPRTIAAAGCLFSLIAVLSAQEGTAIDESAMFGDAETTIADSTALVNTSAGKESQAEKTGLSVSGEMTSAAMISLPRKNEDNPTLSSSMVGNLLLDARLRGGIKGFANAEADYTSQNDSLAFFLREIFVDLSFHNKVYLRTGKQVLQWGRCYFWNPTDLINVERKAFVDKISGREGAYGLKAHVPFGTAVNLYGFIDTRQADSLEKVSGSFKFEFLAGRSEAALSVWGKKDKMPVMGGDISSRLLGLDISGEVSLFRQDNEMIMVARHDSLLLAEGPKEWAPKAALGLTKNFDFGGIPNRITTVLEGYYNSAGYDSRIFTDSKNYFTKPSTKAELPAPTANTDPTTETKLVFFLKNGLYQPNEHAPYYIALFTQFDRFITSDMTLYARAIMNVGERCAVLMSGLTYKDLRDLSLGLTLISNVGPDDREYTYFGSPLTVQATAGITF
ncbi:MAG: hypothetical protein A2293_03325 [Elusimicrobia bacterium RIFOXYB2_FULL_49_7]|nr:MAG: hypothetical protein A2293_03325 [Elusimicrobia bacterium RIFOXYB2_FULL_49_7]